MTLTVSSTKSGTRSYQWMKDDETIAEDDHLNFVGSNTPVLSTSCFLPQHAGNYKCKVSNEVGSVTSNCGVIKGRFVIISIHLWR